MPLVQSNCLDGTNCCIIQITLFTGVALEEEGGARPRWKTLSTTKNFYLPKHHCLKIAIFLPSQLSGRAHTTSCWPSVAHFNDVSVDPKCLQCFIRDLLSPSTNEPTACSLLAAWHPLPDLLLSPGGKRRRCLSLMEFFNSLIMACCSPHSDSVSLC